MNPLNNESLMHDKHDSHIIRHWIPVKQRIEFKICVLVFECRLNEAPVRDAACGPTPNGLIRDSIMIFLDVCPFAPDLTVLLFPVQHFGTVY